MTAKEVIEKTAEKTARAVVREMQRAGLTKENRLGSFKKTERVLYEFAEWRNDEEMTESTKRFCDLIQRALKRIQTDPYYELIGLKYFEGWTHERIAEYFGVDVSVISKRRTKLINRLRPIIFSDDFIRELFEE
jgi:RNA polymerase sigma factor (sigma-70 family)